MCRVSSYVRPSVTAAPQGIMKGMADREYVLGTYDEEIERLGLQHRVWRAHMTECWKRAGLTVGQKVLDVGAGPGYATLDLAQILGPAGKVTALELSERFVAIGKERLAANGVANVDYQNLDLVKDDIGVTGYDVAWCRWVLSFVSDPGLVVSKVAKALRTGGLFAIHEYLEYSTWQCLPSRPAQKSFVDVTIHNWREAGGEPNIGLVLPKLLKDAGFKIRSATPILFTIRPADYAWQWPKAWIASSCKRLVESGDMTQNEADLLAKEFQVMENDPESIMLSPSVIEIIAEKS